MAGTVAVQYIGGGAVRHLPLLGVDVERGGVIEVSEEVAGSGPGPWVSLAEGESPVDGWPVRVGDDGLREQHDPGSGLLAQFDVWVPTKQAKKSITQTSASAATSSEE